MASKTVIFAIIFTYLVGWFLLFPKKSCFPNITASSNTLLLLITPAHFNHEQRVQSCEQSVSRRQLSTQRIQVCARMLPSQRKRWKWRKRKRRMRRERRRRRRRRGRRIGDGYGKKTHSEPHLIASILNFGFWLRTRDSSRLVGRSVSRSISVYQFFF